MTERLGRSWGRVKGGCVRFPTAARGEGDGGLMFVDGDEGVGVEGFGRHHFLPSSALNSRLPYDEINSVGAQILSWEREYGPNTNLPPAK